MTRKMRFVSLVVLLSLGLPALADELYFAVNYGSTTEWQNKDYYYAGSQYMREADTSAIGTSTIMTSSSLSTSRYGGCAVATINGTETVFITDNFSGTYDNYIKSLTWNGTTWTSTTTNVKVSGQTADIGGVTVGKYNTTGTDAMEMYYTINTFGGATPSGIYRRVYNSSTQTWDNVTTMYTAAAGVYYDGLVICDINNDGVEDMYVASWLGSVSLTPKVEHFEWNDSTDTWDYVDTTVTAANTWRFTDLTVGDTDGDGNLELIYGMRGLYSAESRARIVSAEWNGTGFDTAVVLLESTNSTLCYSGVAMLSVPEPATLSLLTIGGGITIIWKRRKNGFRF